MPWEDGPLDPEEAGICMDSPCEAVGCEVDDCESDHADELAGLSEAQAEAWAESNLRDWEPA
jgi:hypothetical protein